ncbi:MAG: hypothetical protein AAFV53_07795 [Myxococcota bacterium]
MLIASLLFLPSPPPLVRFLDTFSQTPAFIEEHQRFCGLDEPPRRLIAAEHEMLDGATGTAWVYHGLPIAQYRLDLDGDGVQDILGVIETRVCASGRGILAVSLTETGEPLALVEVMGGQGVDVTLNDGAVTLTWRSFAPTPSGSGIMEQTTIFRGAGRPHHGD